VDIEDRIKTSSRHIAFWLRVPVRCRCDRAFQPGVVVSFGEPQETGLTFTLRNRNERLCRRLGLRLRSPFCEHICLRRFRAWVISSNQFEDGASSEERDKRTIPNGPRLTHRPARSVRAHKFEKRPKYVPIVCKTNLIKPTGNVPMSDTVLILSSAETAYSISAPWTSSIVAGK